jgi:glycosyltransferase involved in cell wall biosynthesis
VKVLVLSNLYPPDFIGGYEVACKQVVDALLVRGHDVRVLTTVPRLPVKRVDHVLRRLRLADEWNPNVLGLFAVNHLMVHSHSRFVDAHNVHKLIRTIQEWTPDVAYLGSLVGVGGLGLLGSLQQLGVPWVWQLGDCMPALLCTGRRGFYPGLAAEYSRLARGSYICVSSTVKQEIERHGITLTGSVTLLPYWITGERPEPRRTYYDNGHLRVMSAGSVNRDKGTDILIEAAARLRGLGVSNFSVDVYGKVGDPSLAHLIRERGLQEIVKLKGPRPHAELIDLYESYDIFVFPTAEREPFGMVPLEASARGCVPLITSRCGISEWLVQGVHCLKASRSPEAFARVLFNVATGEIPLAPIARRAAEASWREFHLDAIVPRIESVLASAALPGRKPLGLDRVSNLYRMARMAEQVAEGLVEEAMGA